MHLKGDGDGKVRSLFKAEANLGLCECQLVMDNHHLPCGKLQPHWVPLDSAGIQHIRYNPQLPRHCHEWSCY